MKCKRCGSILVKGQIICSVCDTDNSEQINLFNTYPQYNNEKESYPVDNTEENSYPQYNYEEDTQKKDKKNDKKKENNKKFNDLLFVLLMIIVLIFSLYFLNKNGNININKIVKRFNNKVYNEKVTTTKSVTKKSITTKSVTTTTINTTNSTSKLNSSNKHIIEFNKIQTSVLNNINKKAVVDCDDDCSYVYSYDTKKYDLKVINYDSHYLVEFYLLQKDDSLTNYCIKENDLVCSNDKISKKIFK